MDEQRLTAFFKDLHAHPEVSGSEFRTTGKLREALEEAGVRILPSGLQTGLVAEVGGLRPGRVIGLRCDIDALPVCEESGLAYASQNEGVMHACGHDFHASALLGAALLLKEREKELCGTVRLVFQPAEEYGNGAQAVIATGLTADVQEFYALHTYPPFPAGTLGIKEGPVMAAPDAFHIRIRGKGCHGAQPHKGISPVPAAAALTLALQSATGLVVDPFSPAVVTVTHLAAGNTWNVVPEAALIEGTVRTLREADRTALRGRIAAAASACAGAYGCTARFEWEAGSAAVVNDPVLCAAARDIALSMGFAVDRQEDTMSSEDFSDYLKSAPGVFIRVGTGGEYPNHHPRFTADPAALWPAAQFLARLAETRGREK
ncbi:MAG: amidohydrolase [Clostridia bacterium]|nr:amidohydrolase [Clostridia bacterium]